MQKQRTAARSRWAIAALATALVVAACGNSGGDNAAPTTTAGPTTTSAGDGSTTSSVDTSQHVAVDAPGVTDTEIRYSALGTNSNNPLGTCVLDCFADGIQAYFDFVNSQGGVYGRKLVLSEKVDDALGSNQAKALEIVSANDTFGTFSAAQLATGWGDLAKAGIPTYVWMINPAEASGHPEIFGNREVVCITCTQRWVAYTASLAHAKKFGSLGYGESENSKQCADSGAASIEKYSSQIGGTTVGYTNDHVVFGLPNGIGPEVTAMKNAGVDFILGCLDLNGMKTLAQELQRQGMRDSVTLLHTNTYDQQFVKDAGNLFDGDYISVQFRPFEADAGQSGLQDFKDWMAKDGKQISEIAINGWIVAKLAYEGLVQAGPSFDRAKVIAGTNTLTAYTAGGLTQPVDWTRQHEPATEEDPVTHGPRFDCTALVKVNGTAFEMVGDPAKPFLCWPGDTRDWSTPTPTDFE
jgi:ABC-type branched-subunit amino acid transport system substrate-binding protein